MGVVDAVRALLGRGRPTETVHYAGLSIPDIGGMGPAELYRTQPHLRTVIGYLSQNIAQVPIHCFERLSDDDRRRLTDDPLPMLLKQPNPGTTGFELIRSLVADLKLYDYAIWVTTPDDSRPSGWAIYPVPPAWFVATRGGTPWAPAQIELCNPTSGETSILDEDQFVFFHGYHPNNPVGYMSPVEALRDVMKEQIAAWQYRNAIWERGGRAAAFIKRPADAPAWSADGRRKFLEQLSAKYAGPNASQAGGMPLLEDGMTIERLAFAAREEQWLEVAQLALKTVCEVYHINAALVGDSSQVTYGNIQEFRSMLYTETLGPDFTAISDRINMTLVPRISQGRSVYTEFAIAEKLQGNFETQAQVLSTAAGRPYMTVNEVRGRLNMPALDGDADQLVTPLNVTLGGQASPRDSGSQNLNAGPTVAIRGGAICSRASMGDPIRIKSASRPEDADTFAETLRRFYRRQRSAVVPLLSGKASWWDAERWDRELGDDLFKASMTASTGIGQETAETLGLPADTYDPARTEAYLKKVSKSRAKNINATTRDRLQAAIAATGDDSEDPGDVFDEAEDVRASEGGRTLATAIAAFAVVELAHQLGRDATTKTWLVTSSNPRASHAAMDGETVPVDELFSNGMKWPGDPAGGPDEVAGCMCGVELTIP